jgi:hypothetical protein
MSYIDALIPGSIGILLVAAPRLFTKAEGTAFESARRKFRLMGSVLLFSAGIYALLARVEGKTEPAPELQMHRQAVALKNESGWYPAESTGGDYSVLMPVPFNDFTVIGQRTDGAQLKMFCLGAKSIEGYKFSVTAADWFPVKPTPQSLYEGFKKEGQTLSPPLFEIFAGCSSVTFEMSKKGSGAWVRHLVTSSRLVTMIVEYPEGSRANVAEHAKTFLDSLRFKASK